MLDFIRIACAVPPVKVGDVKKNAFDICAYIEKADAQKADIVLFPELALTGFSCGDLFFQDALHNAVKEGLKQIAECSTKHPEITAVVGAPIRVGAKLYNCAAVFAGGTALVTGAFRAVEKKAAEKERNTLFSRNSTKTDLLEGMEQDVYMLHHTIARLINERTGVEHFYYAKIEDMERFEPVCRNIMRGNFKSEETPDLETEQIHRVLMMNPYELRMFCYIMKENGGITEELKTLMDYLCVDKASLADSYLETKFNIDDYNTYEAMVDFEKVVLEELVQFGVAECNFTCAVASKKEKLYIESMDFEKVEKLIDSNLKILNKID